MFGMVAPFFEDFRPFFIATSNSWKYVFTTEEAKELELDGLLLVFCSFMIIPLPLFVNSFLVFHDYPLVLISAIIFSFSFVIYGKFYLVKKYYTIV